MGSFKQLLVSGSLTNEAIMIITILKEDTSLCNLNFIIFGVTNNIQHTSVQCCCFVLNSSLFIKFMSYCR